MRMAPRSGCFSRKRSTRAAAVEAAGAGAAASSLLLGERGPPAMTNVALRSLMPSLFGSKRTISGWITKGATRERVPPHLTACRRSTWPRCTRAGRGGGGPARGPASSLAGRWIGVVVKGWATKGRSLMA